MFLSIVIPAYNEEKRITETLEKYLCFYCHHSVELIIVLNGCTDNTLGMVEPFIKKYPSRVKFKNIKQAIGKGGAVREGFKMAQSEFIGFLDADGSTCPEEFNKLIEKSKGFDGAIASRWKKGSKIVGASILREVVSIGFIFLVKILFFMPFTDTQCGAKIFKKGVIAQVLPKLKVNNMAFDVELLYFIHRAGFRILEVSSVWVDNSSSSSALGSPVNLFKNGLKMFITLLNIRFRK